MLDQMLTIGLDAQALGERAPLGALLTGPENRLAVWAARQLMEAEPIVELLVFVGPSGTGKTLAASELARLWQCQRPDDRVLQTSAADFARNLSHARKADSVEDFRARHRGCQLLVVDGLDDLAERTAAQEELLRTLDDFSRNGGRVVVTMRVAPGEMRGLAPMLASRLIGGLTVPLELPHEATRYAMLKHFAACQGATIDDEGAQLLATRLHVTVPELHGWVLRLANETNNRIDLGAVCAALEEIGADAADGPDLAAIATIVAKRCRVKKAEMQGPARRASLVRARGLAMLAARRLGKQSLSEIGRYFGGRDHTTVMHACRKTEELLSTDPQWAAVWNELAADLREA